MMDLNDVLSNLMPSEKLASMTGHGKKNESDACHKTKDNPNKGKMTKPQAATSTGKAEEEDPADLTEAEAKAVAKRRMDKVRELLLEDRSNRMEGNKDTDTVSYTHLTLPTNREV